MTQERPYRLALTLDQASGELLRETRAGRFDADCTDAVLEAAGSAAPRRTAARRPGGLTDREIEVVRLVAAGLTNPAVAERLGIARRTAEHHVQNVYLKVGVSSRAALALFAHEHEIV
jgi:DNA-binding NarL/FixJ family response regulator